jgi:hypothetical protein
MDRGISAPALAGRGFLARAVGISGGIRRWWDLSASVRRLDLDLVSVTSAGFRWRRSNGLVHGTDGAVLREAASEST